jgi:hypothetical protein
VCASGACAACAGSAATTSAWLTSCVASAKRSVGIAARSAIRGRRWPVREARMSRDCPVTHRLSGPCVRCRQPAWPAHVRGLLIYCEACCGCGQGGAEAAGTDAAPVGARSGLACRMPLARATGVAIALERGGKARGDTPHPSSGLLGPFLAFRGAFYERRRPGLPGWPRPALPPVATKGNSASGVPGGGHAEAS